MTANQEAAEGIQLIPRLFHRIWLGGPMPDEFVRFGQTWLDHHPGWTMREWGDDNLPPLRNQALFDEADTFSGKSDVLRFELLWLYGGVYIDTDFECLRSIEPLLGNVQVFAGFELEWSVATGLMGAVPEHPFIETLIISLPNSVSKHGNANPALSSGPGFLTQCIRAWDADGKEPVTLFASSYFYPYQWYEKHRRFEQFPDAYAVHHWADSWHDPSAIRFRHRVRNRLMRYWITRHVLCFNPWIKTRSLRRR